MGRGFEARAAHPCPTQIWVPPGQQMLIFQLLLVAKRSLNFEAKKAIRVQQMLISFKCYLLLYNMLKEAWDSEGKTYEVWQTQKRRKVNTKWRLLKKKWKKKNLFSCCWREIKYRWTGPKTACFLRSNLNQISNNFLHDFIAERYNIPCN